MGQNGTALGNMASFWHCVLSSECVLMVIGMQPPCCKEAQAVLSSDMDRFWLRAPVKVPANTLCWLPAVRVNEPRDYSRPQSSGLSEEGQAFPSHPAQVTNLPVQQCPCSELRVMPCHWN